MIRHVLHVLLLKETSWLQPMLPNANISVFIVPDRPLREISALSLGKNAVQLNWRPVSPKHTNGMVLGYRVFYNEVHNTSPTRRAASIKVAAEETHLTIGGLRPSTNYSFQTLAFTTKGNGTISAKYFAKTFSGI